jgi:F-type H+-transporting ATPase subunit alpha
MRDFGYFQTLTQEVGKATEIRYPVVIVDGMPHAHLREMVLFKTGEYGYIFSLHKDSVEVLLLTREAVLCGVEVVRTNSFVSIPVDPTLLGLTVDPLGEYIAGDHQPQTSTTVSLDMPQRPLYERTLIKKPLYSGVSIVDLLIPLGKGQRELVVGDRKTGKTSFALSLAREQAREGSVIIYAAIGKTQSEIQKIEQYFVAENITDYLIVASSSLDSPSLIFLTPYTAMSIGEYFSSLGRDVVVVLDDLSTHAKYYREISLVSRRFPGRDSYPADIFYAHSQLLERSGSFLHPAQGEVALSCIPIVELIEGDLSGYISTNIMSMTDGHIFFDTNVFYNGRRPAVNVSLSVTRVGSQTRGPLSQEIHQKLTAFMIEYEKVQALAHFGADLTSGTQALIKKGEILNLFFGQNYHMSVPYLIQLLFFGLIWSETILDYTNADILSLREGMLIAYDQNLFDGDILAMDQINTFDEFLLQISTKSAILISVCRRVLPSKVN